MVLRAYAKRYIDTGSLQPLTHIVAATFSLALGLELWHHHSHAAHHGEHGAAGGAEKGKAGELPFRSCSCSTFSPAPAAKKGPHTCPEPWVVL
jgi:hypothetical protein